MEYKKKEAEDISRFEINSLNSRHAEVNGDCASIRPKPVSQLLLNWRWDPPDGSSPAGLVQSLSFLSARWLNAGTIDQQPPDSTRE